MMQKRTLSLQTLLIVPFVLQVVGITGLVGYLSYRSGQRTVEALAEQIMKKSGELVTQDLNNYLQTGQRINQSHIAALRSGAISLDDIDQLHRFLTLQLFENELPTSLLFGSPQGEFRFINRVYPDQDYGPNTNVQAGEMPYEAGYATSQNPSEVNVFSVDEKGNLQRQAETIKKVDVRERPWYRQAIAKEQPGWSKPFQIGRSEVLAINAFAPFYDDANQLQGVFSVNFSLRRLDTFLNSLAITEKGQAFIIDSDGLIIASSLAQSTYTATSNQDFANQTVYEPGQVKFDRLSASESDIPIMRRTAQQIQKQFGSLSLIQTPQELTVRIMGKRHFLQVTPYQDDYGLDWLIVTGIPEAAFAEDIHNNARRTLLLCSIALVGAIGSGIWTARRITRSLLRLTEATQNVAAGDLEQTLGTSQIQEIETLSESFRQMMGALRQGVKLQKNYQRDLQHQVAEKTKALNDAQRIAHLGSWTFDVASQNISLSPELCRIFGFNPKDPRPGYEDCLQRLWVDDREQMRATIETAIATGQSYDIEYRVIHPDGSIRFVLGRGEAVLDGQGKVTKLIGTGLDITDRKQIEIKLQQSEARLKVITDSVPGCISYIDADQRYRFVNQTYETWFNLRHEDILGRRVEEVIGPESYARARCHIEAALRGETVTYEMELPYQGPHARYVSGVLVPDRNEHQEVRGYYALITDITDRKKLERAFQASEQKTQEIFNSALAAIASMRVFENGTWEIDRVSAGCESLTGYTSEEMTNDNTLWIERILSEDWQAFHQQSLTNIFAEQTGTYEYRFRHKNGSIRWFSQMTNSVRNEAQQCWVVTATSVDITDRKQAEEQLLAEFRLRQAIESSIVEGITTISLEGEQTYVNPAFCRMVGWSQEELLGAKPPFVYWPPEEVDRNDRVLRERLTSEKPIQGIELRFMRRDGELMDVLLLDAPLRDARGNITARLASIYDITERKQAENALKQSEIRFRDISNSSPANIYVLVRRPDGTHYFEHMSRAVETICEVAVDEVIANAKVLLDRIHPEDRAEFDAAARYSEKTLEPFQCEWRIITPSGKVKWLQGRSQPRWRENGELAWYGVVIDETERKVAEELLQERETLLRAIGDNLPKGFVYQFIHEPGKGFYFNYVSAGVERMVGLKPEQVIGHFNALGDLILEEDRQLVERANQESLENLSLFEVDMRKRTLWGEVQWSTVRSIPHRLEDGRTVWYGIELDITNLKKTEAALRENEERFRRAFDDAPIGMALVSPEGRFLRVNQALSHFHGYTIDELMTISIADISDPEDMAQDQALADRVLAGEINTYQLEKRYIHKQGHSIYGLINVSLLRDEQQQPLYFVTQLQDISERRKIDKMKRDFVSIVSHELRTPLTSMRGALGILETGVLKDRPEKARHMMSVAIQNSDRLIRLVNNILDLEQLESGQVALVKEPCHIGELMSNAVESLESIAINAGIPLKVMPLDRVVPLAPDAILQTLTNLLSNAIKFSEPGDTVWLTAAVVDSAPKTEEVEARKSERQRSRDPEIHNAREPEIVNAPFPLSPFPAIPPSPSTPYVLFAIKDEGRGIPADKLKLIFDRFQQVDTSDSRQKGGTGLGLSICKNIVERHGGTIWVDSIEGQGSTFYFTLPIEPAHDSSGELSA